MAVASIIGGLRLRAPGQRLGRNSWRRGWWRSVCDDGAPVAQVGTAAPWPSSSPLRFLPTHGGRHGAAVPLPRAHSGTSAAKTITPRAESRAGCRRHGCLAIASAPGGRRAALACGVADSPRRSRQGGGAVAAFGRPRSAGRREDLVHAPGTARIASICSGVRFASSEGLQLLSGNPTVRVRR